jgi:phosphoribosylformylglycinamidine cyclo-ligase
MSDPDPSRSGSLSYRDAGVDIEAGDEAVRRIRSLVASTRQPEQLSDLGGFAGLFRVPSGLQDPVLVSCADGVGTKLLVAIELDRHHTVGIDLVAMNVNDLIVSGARPLFVLDYIASGKLKPDVVQSIVAGIVAGCRSSSCALLGGETAEMPGMYAEGHYDLAAFAVGVVERERILGPARVRRGDAVIGLLSSGLHSNGYSLARRALLDPAHGGLSMSDPLPGAPGTTVGDALLTPTTIYVEAFARLLELPGSPLHAAAHITGGGLIDNPPRVLPEQLAVELDLSVIARPAIMRAIAAQGVAEDEMRRTFNCGLGMLLVVEPDAKADVIRTAVETGYEAVEVGMIVERHDDRPRVIIAG